MTDETTVDVQPETATPDYVAELVAIIESLGPLCLDDLSTVSKLAKHLRRLAEIMQRHI